MTQEEKEKVYIELINRLEDVKEAIKKQNYGIAIDVLCKPYPEFQVTTHSELKESEDEKIRKRLLELFKEHWSEEWYGLKVNDVISWLEKQGKQKPAWSEEDEKMLNDILMCGEHHCYLDAGNITWLKSIKDRVQPQQKQEWSEEDSPYYDDICEILINLLRSETANVNKTAVQKDLDWLKSLRPHNTWKPSDEQMEALEHFVRSIGESGYASPYDNNTKLLYLLLSDLKKLKG